VAVSSGPQYGTVGREQVKKAAEEAVQGFGFQSRLFERGQERCLLYQWPKLPLGHDIDDLGLVATERVTTSVLCT
jgi:hypothetical protein